MIIIRTLRRDIAKYNKVDEEVGVTCIIYNKLNREIGVTCITCKKVNGRDGCDLQHM